MADLDPPHGALPSAREDAARVREVPATPQTLSPSYRLAFADTEFLLREELRPVRLQLELLKPELELLARGIESTIVTFGSARILEPEQAPARREAAEARSRAAPDDAALAAAAEDRGQSRAPVAQLRRGTPLRPAGLDAAPRRRPAALRHRHRRRPRHHGGGQPRCRRGRVRSASATTSSCRTSRRPTPGSRPSCASSSTISPCARCT